MGKASRLKAQRREHDRPPGMPASVINAIEFQTCLEYGAPRPVVLNFVLNKKIFFPSRWTVEDARIMALGLLKFVEMYETIERKKAAAPL